ncbi:hypothetical protein Tco_1059239 [Tanacetum coccineum]
MIIYRSCLQHANVDGVITKLNARIFKLEAIIQVLNGGVAEKLHFNDDLFNLGSDFYNELNHEFIELFDSTICLSRSTSLDLRSDEDVAKGKTYRMAEKKRPCYGLKDPNMMKLIKNVKPWVEDLSRHYSNMNTVHLTDAFDLFLGKPGMLFCKFPWCDDACMDRRF